jgi:peptidoglycan/LPS O-acetylase OafA/YrhL
MSNEGSMKLRNDSALASLEERLFATLGRPSGFDYLRLGLAVSVIVVHSRITTFGIPRDVTHATELLTGTTIRPFNTVISTILFVVDGILVAGHKSILPMFFALSGFLVAGSLERSKTLLKFLGLRVIRIYPALAVEVLLSAFLIGASVTTSPLTSYFRDPLFLRYLLNVVGDIHFYLPGVFENNPWPRLVNYQLWTVPYELLCYAILAGLLLFGSVLRRVMIPLAAFGVAVADIINRPLTEEMHAPSITGHVEGQLLVVAFLAGVSLYLHREKISWSFPMFAGALTATLPLLWLIPYGEYPAMLTLTYVTVYLGLTNFKRLAIIRGADYSYGIYLYGFVNQQLFVLAAAPRFWIVNALVCVPLTTLVAAFSWHFLEKPAQKLRQPLSLAEQHYLALRNRLVDRVWRTRLRGRSDAIS